jgi:predicted nucleic acid-binding protein
MEWVVDSSLALAWGLPDETSSRADRVLDRITAHDVLWVPALWWYEIANALMIAERRRRITQADRLELIRLYEQLPLQTDAHLTGHTVRQIQSLAMTHHLSAYDTSYLELALRKGLSLATLDKPLTKAARDAGLDSPI